MGAAGIDATDWSRRDVVIRSNPALIAEAVTDLCVDLSTLPQSWWDAVQSDGRDVRVTNEAQTTAYSFELSRFNKSLRTGFLYFDASYLISTSVAAAWSILAGNPSATMPSASDTLGRHNVWEPDAEMVFHLDESSWLDSTAHGRDATAAGTVGLTTTAQLGAAASISNSALTVGDYDFSPALTCMCWFRRTTNAGREMLANKWRPTAGGRSWWLGLSSGNPWVQASNDGNYNPAYNLTSSTTAPINTWSHVALTLNGAVTQMRMYQGGALTDSSNSFPASIWNSSTELAFGREGTTYGYTGQIDEMRIYSSAKSANWVATHYNNQSNPAVFWDVLATPSGAHKLTLHYDDALIGEFVWDAGDRIYYGPDDWQLAWDDGPDEWTLTDGDAITVVYSGGDTNTLPNLSQDVDAVWTDPRDTNDRWVYGVAGIVYPPPGGLCKFTFTISSNPYEAVWNGVDRYWVPSAGNATVLTDSGSVWLGYYGATSYASRDGATNARLPVDAAEWPWSQAVGNAYSDPLTCDDQPWPPEDDALEAEAADTLPAMDASSAAAPVVVAAASDDLPALDQAVAASPVVSAAAEDQLPAVDQSAIASPVVGASIDDQLPALDQAATAAPIVSAAADDTLPMVDQAAEVELGGAASVDDVLPGLDAQSAATPVVAASAADVLPAPDQLAAASPVVQAAGDDLLPTIDQAAAAAPIVAAQAADLLPAIEQAIAATPVVAADVVDLLPSVRQHAVALPVGGASAAYYYYTMVGGMR